MFLYFYKAVDGTLIPATTEKTLGELKQDFKDSITPLGKIIAITSRKEALLAIAILEAQLTQTSAQELGLIHSIETAIERLNFFKASCRRGV